eukprot:287736-Chlamydomonas_euryale.AAC.2
MLRSWGAWCEVCLSVRPFLHIGMGVECDGRKMGSMQRVQFPPTALLSASPSPYPRSSPHPRRDGMRGAFKSPPLPLPPQLPPLVARLVPFPPIPRFPLAAPAFAATLIPFLSQC